MAERNERIDRGEGVDSDRQPFLADLADRRYEYQHDVNYTEFLDDLTRISGLSRADAERAATSVLCLLDQNLQAGSIRDPDASIPDSVALLMFACRREGETPSLAFNPEAFLSSVAVDLNCNEDEALERTTFVFQALRRRMSHEEIVHFARMLPVRIQNIFFQSD